MASVLLGRRRRSSAALRQGAVTFPSTRLGDGGRSSHSPAIMATEGETGGSGAGAVRGQNGVLAGGKRSSTSTSTSRRNGGRAGRSSRRSLFSSRACRGARLPGSPREREHPRRRERSHVGTRFGLCATDGFTCDVEAGNASHAPGGPRLANGVIGREGAFLEGGDGGEGQNQIAEPPSCDRTSCSWSGWTGFEHEHEHEHE